MSEQTMRVAIYGRVSTSDKGQDPELQLVPLREYCKQRGWQIVGEFVDCISGIKAKRPQLDKLLLEAKKRKIDVIAVWKLDRFGRSLKHLVNTIEDLQEIGVSFFSYMEALDFTSASGKLMFNILAAFSQFERDIISDRVRAGMAYARFVKNVPIGRKPTPVEQVARIIEVHESEKLSVRQIAQRVRTPRSTVFRVLQQFKAGEIGRDGQLVRAA